MPDSDIPSYLHQFREAITSGNMGAARDLLQRIDQAYEEVAPAEAVTMRQASEALPEVDPTTKTWKTLNRYIHNQTILEIGRGTFLEAAAIYLDDPSSHDATQFREPLQQLGDQEKQLLNQRAAVEEVLTSVSLAPHVEIVAISQPDALLSPDDPFDLTVTVQNVGDEPAADVQVTHESELSVEPATATLGTLQPNQQRSTTFEGAMTTPAANALTVHVTSENAGTAEQTLRLPVQEARSSQPTQGRISNGNVTAEVTTSDTKRPTFINWVRKNGTTYTNDLKTVPIGRTANEYFTFESTETIRDFTDSTPSGYWVRRQFTTSARKLFVDTKIAVLSDQPIFLARINFANYDTESISIDTKPGFVADGIGLGRADLVSPADPYRFAVAGHQPQPFNTVEKWTKYDISGDIPYVMAFDPDRALAIGLLQGTTGPQMAMTEGQPHQIRFFVKPVDVAPAEYASWLLAITAHSGGANAVDDAHRLLQVADEKASALNF